MWLDPNSLKLVYLEMVFTTRHPLTLGCVSITSPRVGAGGNRIQLSLRATTTLLLLMCGLGRNLLKAGKGERMQRDHSRARLGEIQATKGFCNLTWRLHHVWQHTWAVCNRALAWHKVPPHRSDFGTQAKNIAGTKDKVCTSQNKTTTCSRNHRKLHK